MAEKADPPAPDPKDKGKTAEAEPEAEGDKLTLTQEELDAKLAEARKEEREKLKKKQKQQKREAEEDDDEAEEEDPNEIISKAERRAAEAEQERDQAVKEALLAKVENKLRDFLTLNHREFIGNAPDIMLHIEKALSPKSNEQEVARLIKSHVEAFVDRTKAVRKPASGAPLGGARLSRSANIPGGNPEDTERRTVAAKSGAAASDHKPFSTIHWNG